MPTYFRSRTRAEDYTRSVQQVRDLRRALDVLAAQPGLDRTRVAYVGHDFGAMYGTLAAVVDPRVTHFVFMAGTASFSDWFLTVRSWKAEARERFIAELAPLDPVKWVPKLRGPVLMQFADNDEHVSTARREAARGRGAEGRRGARLQGGTRAERRSDARSPRRGCARHCRPTLDAIRTADAANAGPAHLTAPPSARSDARPAGSNRSMSLQRAVVVFADGAHGHASIR